MKILLTGATGFLGKYVLNLLLADTRIEKIVITSRNQSSHPHSKVKMLQTDLSHPKSLNDLDIDIDAAVHLAGLYDFNADFKENYNQNVLPTTHLISKLKQLNQSKRIPIYFASTYAVGFGSKETLLEEPLKKIPPPPKEIPYAYTKAIAEKFITDSNVPSRIFRLGVIIGESKTGTIEKMDGAYPFLRTLLSLQNIPAIQHIKYLPIPAKKGGILPLVPVDSAAKIFHQALFMNYPEDQLIYGAYNSDSVTFDDFCTILMEHFLPGTRPIFIEKPSGKILLKLQEKITGIHQTILKFSIQPVQLKNEKFKSHFSHLNIPPFHTYKDSFISGYENFSEGRF